MVVVCAPTIERATPENKVREVDLNIPETNLGGSKTLTAPATKIGRFPRICPRAIIGIAIFMLL